MVIHPVEVDGVIFYVKKSDRKNKKYDVFDCNYMYITSYGDLSNDHYYDAFGEYKHLNHYNILRRNNYRQRAEVMANGYLADPYSAHYWNYWTLN